jgi:pimeloyl-ACP methyl ester carboxylesterase
MPAISAAEIRTMLGTVFAAREPRRIIVVLDFNAFAGGPDDRQDSAGPLPAYLYDRNPLNDLPYLLSSTVLRKSIAILAGRSGEAFGTDANAPWYWADRMRFGRAEVLRGLDPEHINARFRQPARTLPGMRRSFERNILPMLEAHPQTQFDLVWPPYSTFVWQDFAQRGQLDVTLAFKRYVTATVQRMQNVRIVDFRLTPKSSPTWTCTWTSITSHRR